MKTKTNRTAIRVLAHILKVCGYENTEVLGILHYANPKDSSQLWALQSSCLIDRQPTEVFIDRGISEEDAMMLLTAMLEVAIARVEKLN